MTGFVKLIIAVVFSLSLSTVFAQKPKPAPAKPVAARPGGFQKYTPPKLISMLGNRSDSINVLTVDEALQIVQLPIKVTDDKKTAYTISSYQALYKRKAVTEDEKSGRVSPVVSSVSELFKTTPLPSIWINTISEQLRAGEELYFFDIVVKDAQGRLMFAPDIRLKIR
jgi:hypothetical protein